MTIHWWTLGIQAVNVVILIWLLGRFFWRPFATMIEQRRTAAQQILAEAETKRRQATDAELWMNLGDEGLREAAYRGG